MFWNNLHFRDCESKVVSYTLGVIFILAFCSQDCSSFIIFSIGKTKRGAMSAGETGGNLSENLSLNALLITSANTTNRETQILATFLSFLAILIIAGNMLIMLAFKCNPRLRTRTNSVLVSLAISDLLVGMISMPLWISTLFTSIGPGWYDFYISFDIFSGIASILHITVIAGERYVALVRPFLHRVSSTSCYRLAILCAWLYAAIIASLFPIQKRFDWQKAYTILVFITGFTMPFCFIGFIYPSILVSVRTRNRRLSKKRLELRICYERQKKTAKTILVITVLLFIAWLPFFLINVIAIFCLDCIATFSDFPKVIAFAKWMHYSNSAVNPFVYAYRNREMRKAFRKTYETCRQSAGRLRFPSLRDRTKSTNSNTIEL